MAELILTEDEKKADTYLEWTDEALGSLVKKTAKNIKDKYGRDAAWIVSAATLLVCQVNDANATESEIKLTGVTDPKPLGDWQITIEKL